MSKWNLRKRQRNISYYEPEEIPLDEYVYCDDCSDIVYEYCAIHGPLLVIPDDKVPSKTDYPPYVPFAALTIPHVFLHIAPSYIPGAGLGVFSTLTLPRGVRFGPYCGKKVDASDSDYCWQIRGKEHKPSYLVDAKDANNSNWMRYVNCARHWSEQNLVPFQYQGQIYYRTIKIIPRFTELLVFYGSEFANYLKINMRLFNSSLGKEKLYNIDVIIKNSVAPRVTQTPAILENEPAIIAENISENPDVIFNKMSSEIIEVVKPGSLKNLDDNSNINNIQKDNQLMKVDTSIVPVKTCFYNSENDSEKKYKCSVCQYRTHIRQKIETHLRIHTGEKPYQCNVCQRKFSESGNLKTHLRIHTGEKPYQCNVCQRKFSVSGHLKYHLRIHTGEKPYQCNVCQRKFYQSGNLKTHLRIHTGEKPYQCNVCQRKFYQSGHLKYHLRIHTGEKPYQCNVCQRKFYQSGNLKTHLRIHTGEKPYQCNVCQRKFYQSGDLKIHLRIHTGEKPYQCNVCQRKFSKSGNLKTHSQKHRGEKPSSHISSQKSN